MTSRPGERFLEVLRADYELGPDAEAAAESIASHMNLIERLEEAASGDLFTKGSRAQPRLNPVIAELRQARLALARMLKELGLPEDDAPPARQAAAQMARRRWSK